jgi:hypothetical protein
MSVIIGGVTITGRVRAYVPVPPAAGEFAGTNVNLIFPIEFSGSEISQEFIGTNENLVFPIAFAGDANTFTATVNSVLPISFAENTIESFSGNTVSNLPLSFKGSLIIDGEEVYTTPGTFTWIVPEGVTSVSAVCVGSGSGSGGGGTTSGSGGGLSYVNYISVTPGETLDLRIAEGGAVLTSGSNTWIKRSGVSLVEASGGTYGSGYAGGSPIVGTGGSGAAGGRRGGGAAGGYSTTGGLGANAAATAGAAGTSGSPGGGGGNYDGTNGAGGGGGGIGISGVGTSGAGGAAGTGSSVQGKGGSRGSPDAYCTAGSAGVGTAGGAGGFPGGGAGGPRTGQTAGGIGGNGAIRIVWGADVSYPNNASVV